jgi:prolyl-tRNA synthetase
LIGALIMAHSDDNGLVLPPRIAPTQVVIVPIFKTANKDQVLGFAAELKAKINAALGSTDAEPRRVILDDNENSSPGWKFAEWELQGVPVRVELGARDIEAGTATVYRRDTQTKVSLPIDQIPAECQRLMSVIQADMLAKARAFQVANTVNLTTLAEFEALFAGEGGGGFAKVPWAGTAADEKKLKELTKATIRCLPFGNEAEAVGKTCFYTGKPATKMAIFAKAY